jgi:hypothetical protein
MITKDEFLSIVKQADFCVSEDGKIISTNNSYGIIQYELEAFAKLIIEKCATLCENTEIEGSLAYGSVCAEKLRSMGKTT